MNRKTATLTVLTLCCLLSAPAAQAGGTIRGGDGGYDAIAGGAWDLTLVDAIFLSRYTILDDTSMHSLSFFGGPGLRMFAAKNFSIHFTPAFTYDLETVEDDSSSTWSLLPMLGVDYYLNLPGNFFLKPGLSVGYYWGQKSVDLGGGISQDSTISGFAGRIQFMLVYYAGPNWNLRGGLDLLLRCGSDDPDPGEELTATLLNTGFSIGIGYTF